MTEIDVSIVAGKVQAIPIPVTFTDVQLIAGPGYLHGFSVRDTFGPAQGLGAPTATAAAAAAGNATASLPVNDALSQFILSFGNVAAANTLAVTVVNAVGGTITYAVPLAVGQNQPFIQSFPTPLQAVAGQQIGVTVTGNANSPTVSITAYGVGVAISSIAEIRDGNNVTAEIALTPNNADTRWFGDNGVWIRNQLLYHPVSGLITGAVYATYDRGTF